MRRLIILINDNTSDLFPPFDLFMWPDTLGTVSIFFKSVLHGSGLKLNQNLSEDHTINLFSSIS